MFIVVVILLTLIYYQRENYGRANNLITLKLELVSTYKEYQTDCMSYGMVCCVVIFNSIVCFGDRSGQLYHLIIKNLNTES